MELLNFIREHAQELPAQHGTEATNLVFFNIQARGNPDARVLRELIQSTAGTFTSVDLFDGGEHSYIEIGAWLGSQHVALALMGLGVQLGLWQLLSPRTMFGDSLTPAEEQAIAGSGLISIQAVKNPVPA